MVRSANDDAPPAAGVDPPPTPGTGSLPRDGDDAALVAEHLARRFGPVHAVADASLRLDRGQVTALVGPNGSGKTTLLLMLAGLLAPDAGSVRVRGLDPTRDGARARRRLGWMPDAFGTWDSLTAREVLTTVGAMYRLPGAAARARADDLLSTVHLTEYADAPAHVLSRGQKQRLGLARALVHAPEVLLLDEPAAGLDPRSRVDLRHLVRELADGGTAILISSHVLVELDEMVDDAAFLSRGVTTSARDATPGSASGRWRLRVLDAAALSAWAASVGLELHDDPDADRRLVPDGGAAVVVTLPDEHAASALLRDSVAAGVPVSSLAPAGGALEQVYLSLEEERR